ncbi:hypothetical protein [Microbacterium jejuense]|uniref:hypothetical protein n=1 Tax=Microbacterium jejuense TaxID=1263637 RepID=UPI0031E61677
MPRLLVFVTPNLEDPMSAASTSSPVGDVRTDLAAAVGASRTSREAAERALRMAVAVRSRAAEALERTARQHGIDESERARLRAEYAAADQVVADRRAAVDTAREFERAAAVVAEAFDAEASTASPLAAALRELIGSQSGRTASRSRSGRTARRAAPGRVNAARPRTA